MNILVVSSSGRMKGNSDLLCDELIRGAKEKGNIVSKVSLHQLNIHPCKGCDYCQEHDGCIQDDDMKDLSKVIQNTDVLVMATPVYFYNLSSSLKLLIDRTYAFYKKKHFKKTILIATSADPSPEAMKTTISGYESYLSCLDGVENLGMILAAGVEKMGDVLGHSAFKQAYELGKSLQ